MASESAGFAMEVDPRLVEESVLLATGSLSPTDRSRFRMERDALYSLKDPTERDSRFRELHGRWFARLRMAAPIVEALSEHPALRSGTRFISRCVVGPAANAAEEGADLHEDRRQTQGTQGLPALLIRLRPQTLVDGEFARSLLDRELMFVADMLNPAFGYSASDSRAAGMGPLQTLARDRYRVLWSATVDGRLAALGRLGPGEEEARRSEFVRALPMFEEIDARELFRKLSDGPRPPHADLWSIAVDPCGALPRIPRRAGGAELCPLCGFPSASLFRDSENLPGVLRERIASDFPGWSAARGICPQCAGIYTSRGGRTQAPACSRTG